MKNRISRLEHQLQECILPEEKIDLLNQIAWKCRTFDIDLLISYASEALELAEKANYQKGIAFGKLNLSFARYFEASIEESTRLTRESLDIFEQLNDKWGKGQAFTLLGIAFWTVGQYEKGFNYALKGEYYHQEAGDREGLAWNYCALAGLYADLHNYGYALDYYRKAQTLFEQIGEESGMSPVLSGIGNIYQALGKYDLALEKYHQSLEIAERLHAQQFRGRILNDLGVLFELMAKPQTALDYLKQSLAIRQEIGNMQGIITSQINMAKVYIQLGDYVQAVSFLEQAEINGRSINAKPKLLRIHQLLAQVYKKRFEPWNALEHYEQHLQMKVEVIGEENTIQLRNLESAFNIEKAERETEIYRLKNIELARANDQISQKQQELERLNNEIRTQHETLSNAFVQIERMNKDLIDSIHYAQRIQKSILSSSGSFQQLVPESFIFFKPKDIVSGDFYWFSRVEKKSAFQRSQFLKVIIVADCTGHGVPGAFMTVMGNDLLNEIINHRKVIRPDEILHRLHEKILDTLRHENEQQQVSDGMDIAVVCYDERSLKLQFAGAKLPLCRVRHNEEGIAEMEIIKGSRFSVGHEPFEKNQQFQLHELDVQAGDAFYLFSDGFQDQFGHLTDRKYMKRNLKNFLLQISNMPMSEQREQLNGEFLAWKGDFPQTDDVTVLGFKIPEQKKYFKD